ncbi:MAG: ABC transporter ATP-binding protein [Halanaerobiales bacterium]
MSENELILEVKNLKKYFPVRKGVFRRVVGQIKAVDDISFFLKKGETLGLVGESGCGKSTTGECLLRLMEPTSGKINYREEDGNWVDVISLSTQELNDIKNDIQMIFQDPMSSLNPRMSIRDIIVEPLEIHKIGTKKSRTETAKDLLDQVGLSQYFLNRYPHEFSGGQRQRVGIARALTLDPRIIVCDEPVSALDVSVQAQILNILSSLQQERGLTYLFIAHNLSVVEHISDRVMVMYLGKLVEIADTDSLYNKPLHPYTEILLESIPEGDPKATKKRRKIGGVVPDPSNPPTGCNLHPRCPYAREKCKQTEPELRTIEDGSEHFVACHFAKELDLKGYSDLVEGLKTG